MARHINADKLLSDLPDDLPYKASIKRVLIQAPTADVVPRAELAVRSFQDAATIFSLQESNKKIAAKAEVAREIFMDIDRVVEKYSMGDIEYPAFVDIIAKFKKKYIPEEAEERK